MSAPPSGFSALHAIEAQLVMQHCDWRSLIALARTTRRTYEMACTPFAWKHTPLCLPTNVTVVLNRSTEPYVRRPDPLPGSPEYALLHQPREAVMARRITPEEQAEMRSRHVAAVAARPPQPPRPPPVSELIAKSRLLSVAPAVSFRWTPVQIDAGSTLAATDQDIEAMFKLRNMTELDLRTTVGSYGLQAPFIARLLTHTCTKPLRSFLGGHVMDRQLIHMLEDHHPMLERLWCQGAQTDHDLLPMLDTIPKLPALTELHFTRATYGQDTQLVALGKCKGLKTLGLHGGYTCTQAILRALQSSGSLLRELRLIGAGRCSDWGACFELVPTLEVLRLDRCDSSDAILKALAPHCPALHTLWVHCGRTWSGVQPLLDSVVFDTLLSLHAHLRATLSFEPLQCVLAEHIAGCRRNNGVDRSDDITRDWDQGREALERVAAGHPKHIQFSIQEAPIN